MPEDSISSLIYRRPEPPEPEPDPSSCRYDPDSYLTLDTALLCRIHSYFLDESVIYADIYTDVCGPWSESNGIRPTYRVVHGTRVPDLTEEETKRCLSAFFSSTKRSDGTPYTPIETSASWRWNISSVRKLKKCERGAAAFYGRERGQPGTYLS